MKTDELFHEFFQIAPHAVFELLQIKPGCPYRFSSPVVKASQRQMDGLLEPTEPGHPRYFLEVQGYLDESIYWRVIHQVGLYFEQRPELNGSPWQAIILYLDKSYDPGPETLGLLHHGQMPWLIRGVLPGLLAQSPKTSPILNALRPLASQNETEVRQEAANWAASIRQLDNVDTAAQARLLDILIQFVLQRFTRLSRKEIETMLRLTPIEETVAGQEWIQEGFQKGVQEGFQKALRENIVEVLATRFEVLPVKTLQTIERLEDLTILKILFKQAVKVDSVAAFERIINEYSELGPRPSQN
ncbi:MAG: DUF2887 domain-containing protein [Chloroflexota bacterium]